jgi:hypothetical protein
MKGAKRIAAHSAAPFRRKQQRDDAAAARRLERRIAWNSVARRHCCLSTRGSDAGSDRRTGRQGPRLASQVSRTHVVESGDLTVQLIFDGPLVLLTYVVAFAMTPGDRASADYPRPPRKSCDADRQTGSDTSWANDAGPR